MILVTRNCSVSTDCNITFQCENTYPLEIEWGEGEHSEDDYTQKLYKEDFISIWNIQQNTSKTSSLIHHSVSENNDEEVTLNIEDDGFISAQSILIPKSIYMPINFDYGDQISWYAKNHYYVCWNRHEESFYYDSNGNLIFYKVIEKPSDFQPEDTELYSILGIDINSSEFVPIRMSIENLVQEITEINPDSSTYIKGIKQSLNIFSICHLRKCYKNICQTIFNSRIFDKCFKAKVNSDLIFRRDLVWATINVIQYLVDSKQFAEAQLVLERINECPGLCTEQEKESGKKGCGCK